MKKTYQINLTPNQLTVIEEALEFFSRFCSGQWEVPSSMEETERKLSEGDKDFWKRRNETNDNLIALKSVFTKLPINAFYGIGSPKLCESAKVAYDIYRPILELFNKEWRMEHPEESNWNVYSSPGLSYSKEGRIEIKAIKK